MLRACQTLNAAPSGSAKTAIRPKRGMSNGSLRVVPPASWTFEAVSSTSSTQMYVFHTARAGMPGGIEPTAATSPPRMRPMKYRVSASVGITSSTSQPKRPA